jgi:hypothetical protein
MKPLLVFIVIGLGIVALLYAGFSVFKANDTPRVHWFDKRDRAGLPLG